MSPNDKDTLLEWYRAKAEEHQFRGNHVLAALLACIKGRCFIQHTDSYIRALDNSIDNLIGLLLPKDKEALRKLQEERDSLGIPYDI